MQSINKRNKKDKGHSGDSGSSSPKLLSELMSKSMQQQQQQQQQHTSGSSSPSSSSFLSAPKSNETNNDEAPHSPSLERFSAISKPRESLLTTPQNANIQWGTFNYIAICYVMVGFSMMAEHYVKYGTPMDFDLFYWLVDKWYIGFFVWIGLVLFSYVTYISTRLFVNNKIPAWLSVVIYFAWQITAFYVTCDILFQYNLSPILSGGTGLQLCVYTMKNHSYWYTNFSLKRGSVKASKNNSPITRRDLIPNVSLKHFSFFLVAPTLVYEPYFPRTPSIRWTYVLKETLAFIGTFTVFYLMLCYCNPLYKDVDRQPFMLLVVRLSLPAMSLWIFYGVFHCLLNIFAEITRFADREFYQDWWNATTFDMWWRRWNRPVHKWMLRHVYTDSMHTVKMNKFGAFISTFLLSALLHEIVMVLSFKFVRPILSTTMILQIGLVYFTQLPILQKTRFGNVVMWITVFIGQPFVQLLYSMQYQMIWNAQISDSKVFK
ncbi:membrane bound O-acyl transferase family protein [Heterostelium album PN500]|uniref:O-acyltransferase n=1 Tax=Heterostelium pallidum (strain ATCC 26659 / Pp 5 / PN500) TaxID=670386 RepID=D3BEP6_HETP5|nr:membrane bound O-acyl transferase family protein [Heterostelium album PN500]EFA80377.1 membrane bound O-acyl transferase family protein [Heterostelium album PN500]|eukprot:XP_020432497.1 membrane bound O-acyl transferase family protein [Heterostelium album PN500]